MRVVIVGAGIGGISSALLLKKRGFEVVVVEKNDTPGGRARYFQQGEFKFDMGPSWYLMPEVFQDFFSSLGEEGHPVIKVEPKVRIDQGKLGEKGESITFYKDERGEELQRYLEDTKFMYELSKKFIRKEMTVLDFLDRDILSNVSRFPIFETLDRFNSRYFKEEIMMKSMGFSSVFLGGSPYKIPAIYAMINYSIFAQGVYYPEGGFEGYVKRLYNLARRMGVEFKFNSPVNKVKVEDKKVVAVYSGEERIEGDVFLFNMDYHYADNLLPEPTVEWSGRKLAPSSILAFLGVKGEVNLPHHTVVVNGDWRDHFSSIEERRLPSIENMSYYVSYRRATDDKLMGQDLVILIPVAPGLRKESSLVDAALKDLTVKSESKFEVKYMRTYGPEDFSQDYNAYLGTSFGLAHTLDQTGPFRMPMRNKRYRNLFYVGQYTQPGIGVPMVTLSAMIVSKKISESF
ncbi:MAG: phytoene desaturase family protein [Metallosphaera sp.]